MYFILSNKYTSPHCLKDGLTNGLTDGLRDGHMDGPMNDLKYGLENLFIMALHGG